MIKRPICLLCLVFATGIWLMGCFRGNLFRQHPRGPIINAYMERNNNQAEVYGTIYGYSLKGDAVYLRNSYLKYYSKTISIEKIKIYIDESRQGEGWTIGTDVLVKGRLSSMQEPRNPGQFDSVSYYAAQHIYYYMTKVQITEITEKGFSVRRIIGGCRSAMAASIQKVAGDKAGIYYALILGDKSFMEQEEKDRFQMMGIIHIIAISGLHLSLISMGLYKLLLKIGLPIYLSGGLSILLLLVYGIFTGESVSTMRATFMFVIMMWGRIMGRTYDLLTALALAAILIMLESPGYLYSSGFILSFGCVIGITLVRPSLERVYLQNKTLKSRKLRDRIKRSLLAGVSVQVTTLPVLMYFFFELPVYSIVINLIVIPTVAVVLVSGFAAGFIGLIQVNLGRAAALPGMILLEGYDKVGEILTRMPMAVWITGRPKPPQIVVYYFLLIIFLWIVRRKKPYWKEEEITVSKRIARGLVFGGIVTAGIVVLTHRSWDMLQITSLDVGQGDSIVVSTAEEHHYLIDGGSSNIEQVGRYRIIPYLKSQGISVLEGIWVSHTDNDHISGVKELLEIQLSSGNGIKVKQLFLPCLSEPPGSYDQLEMLARKAGVKVYHTSNGIRLQDGRAAFSVLAPLAGETTEDINESSQVLQINYGEFSGLFTGDIGEETERKNYDLWSDVDFLKVAHHGSRYSTGNEFLKKTLPEIAVISSSSTNTYGHPHPDTLSRLEVSGSQIWCTKDTGAVMLRTDGNRIWVESYLDR